MKPFMLAGQSTVTRAPAVSSLLPVLDDAVATAMRPDTRILETLVVSKTGAGDFRTFHEATNRAYQIQTDALRAAGLRDLTPNFWVQIVAEPGTYDDDYVMGPSRFMSFVAADPTRGATTIINPTAGEFVRMLDPTGCFHWEGIDVVIKDSTDGHYAPKYCAHCAALFTTVFTRCLFDASQPTNSLGSGSAIGTDGADGGTIVCHDMIFNGGTNQHGWASMTVPMTVIYSKVTSAPGRSLGFGPLSDTRADELWVVDCDTDAAFIHGAASVLHCNPERNIIRTGQMIGGTIDNRTDWPIPTGCLSARDRQQFGV